MWWSGFSRAALVRLLADRRGTTAIEFAVVGGIFFTLLLGAVDVGRYQITQQSLRSIAAEAARFALIAADQAMAASPAGISGVCAAVPSSAALKAGVTTPTNLTPFLVPANLTLVGNCVVGAGGARTITITASYPFQFVMPVLPQGLPSRQATSSLSY